MTWVRIDDAFPEHSKVLAAGDNAGWLFVCGLAYCARNLTDGKIPAAQVPRLTGLRQPLKLAERLLEVGLWEPHEQGFLVHDYLKYQPSAEDVKNGRRSAKDRQERSRAARAVTDVSQRDKDVTDVPVTPPPHGRARARGSGEGVVVAVDVAVEDHAGAQVDLGDENLNRVITILQTCPRFTFDPMFVGVANMISAHPTLDHEQAAHTAAARGADPIYRTTSAARAFEFALRDQAKDRHGGQARDTRNPLSAVPVAERPAIGGGNLGKYDRAAGLA